MPKAKVLIIKLGYSETLDPDTSGLVSLGDVFRSTVLLHLFPQDRYHITWIVDERAWPLLRGNPCIDRVIKINPFTQFQLLRANYDIVINLEKDPGVCALADAVPAWQRFGFRFDPITGEAAGHLRAEQAFSVANNPTLKRELGRNWSQILYDMVGAEWRGENYVLGYRPSGPAVNDVGLNLRVGSKFPLKTWPKDNWTKLARRLEAAKLSVSWQPEQDNVDEIERYIDWIASCRVLVTNDSLGLHFAAALSIPTVALFGPSLATDMPDSNHIVKIRPSWAADCKPCFSRHCQKKKPCMPLISVDEVFDAVRAVHERVHERAVAANAN
jgi:heptosyltransferase-2